MSLFAALCAGAWVWVLARRLFNPQEEPSEVLAPGTVPATVGRLSGFARRGDGAGSQAWLAQAGAAVTPGQFWAVSAGLGAVCFLVLLALSRALAVSALPAVACGAAPYAYWSGQRRKRAAARSAAWPDALRYLVGALGAGIATLHDGLAQLCTSGPEPLRAPMSRYLRLSGRVGDRQALEAVRAELADPISDPVLLAFEGAVDEGTETVLRVLGDLGAQITADLQLAEKIRTLQTQSRVATWGCFVLPYAVLVFLCATNAAYRQFFSSATGLVLVLGGSAMSVAGLLVARRLVRPIATTERVFAEVRTMERAPA